MWQNCIEKLLARGGKILLNSKKNSKSGQHSTHLFEDTRSSQKVTKFFIKMFGGSCKIWLFKSNTNRRDAKTYRNKTVEKFEVTLFAWHSTFEIDTILKQPKTSI